MTTGKAKQDFPGAYLPFDKQAGLVPASGIDTSPTIQLCINEDWIPFIITCLKTLARPETWDDTYDNTVRAASEISWLISKIRDGCGLNPPDVLCISGSFADLDYDFFAVLHTPPTGIWVRGTGWQSILDTTTNAQVVAIDRLFTEAVEIRSASFHVNSAVGSSRVDAEIHWYLNGVNVRTDRDFAITGGFSVSTSTPIVADEVLVTAFRPEGSSSPVITLDDFGMCYTGTFPLAVLGGWSHTFDFTAGNGGFSALQGGNWTSGQGWQPTAFTGGGGEIFTLINIRRDFDARDITSISLQCNITKGTFLASFEYGLFADFNNGGSNRVLNLANPAMPAGTGIFLSANQEVDVASRLDIDICTGTRFSGGLNGFATLRAITINGKGVDPFA